MRTSCKSCACQVGTALRHGRARPRHLLPAERASCASVSHTARADGRVEPGHDAGPRVDAAQRRVLRHAIRCRRILPDLLQKSRARCIQSGVFSPVNAQPTMTSGQRLQPLPIRVFSVHLPASAETLAFRKLPTNSGAPRNARTLRVSHGQRGLRDSRSTGGGYYTAEACGRVQKPQRLPPLQRTAAPEGATVTPSPRAILPDVIEAVEAAGRMVAAEFCRPGGPRFSDHVTAPVDHEIELFLRDRLTAPAARPLRRRGSRRAGGRRRTASAGWSIRMTAPAPSWRAAAAAPSRSRCCAAGTPVLGVVFAPLEPGSRPGPDRLGRGRGITRNGRPVAIDLRQRRPGRRATWCS